MLYQAFILCLQIIAISVCFSEGMILGWFRIGAANLLDWMIGKRWSKIIQQPLWGCTTCMASVWTCILTWSFDIRLILLVAGMNYLIDKIIIPYAPETD